MSARSRQHSVGKEYSRSAEHRRFRGQPSIELATGACVRLREDGEERVVELLDVDGWREIKRWKA